MIADGYSPPSPTAWTATGKRRFIVHYLDKQLRRMAKDGHSLAIRAESPERVRSGDAWRVYDFALGKGIVGEVKFVLRVLNPFAFSALCEYEGLEIEAAIAKDRTH